MKKVLKSALLILTAGLLLFSLAFCAFAAKQDNTLHLEAKNASKGIKLSWTELEAATSYRVFRKTDGSKKYRQIGKTDKTTLTFTDKKADTESTYTYIVKAYSSGSVYKKSNSVATDFTKPTEIKKFTVNKKSISLSWQKDPKAAAYEIYRTKPDGSKLSLYKTVKAGTLKLTDKDVSTSKKYGYAIRTVNKNGKKSALPEAEYCLMMKVPKITKAENTTKGIRLTWKKTPLAESYNIYRRSADSDSFRKILNTKKLSATDTGALNAKKYVYIVRAVYNGVQSQYDKEGFTALHLSPVQDVTVEYVTKTSNRISWSPNRGATDYNVYRRAENSTEWTRIKRTSKTSFTDKNVKRGKVYAYFVRAYINNDYKSAASKTVYSVTVDPKGKMVALTYDDGPSNIITSRILDTLEKHDAKATFFVLGSRIENNSEPLKRAVSLGCEIGNHTYGHVNLPSLDKKEIEKEISTTNSLVKKYTGTVPKLARAPGGSTSEYSRKAVNMPFVYWSIDTRDWETMDKKSIVAHVKNETRDGSIILMHDIYQATAEATEVIVPWLEKEGYQLVTVSELMKYKGIELQKGVTYYNAY